MFYKNRKDYKLTIGALSIYTSFLYYGFLYEKMLSHYLYLLKDIKNKKAN